MGYVWYADEAGGDGYADMGRTGASAVAHYLNAKGNAGFLTFANRNAVCIGEHPDTFIDTHTSPLLGMVWTALGAATDPASFRIRQTMKRPWGKVCHGISQCIHYFRS